MSARVHTSADRIVTGASALLRILRRPLKAELPLSSLAALAYMAANPGEHKRSAIMRAINRTAHTNNQRYILGALESRGLATSRQVSGSGRGGRLFLHKVTPEGLAFLGLSEP